MQDLTPPQKKALNFIVQQIAKKGSSPTLREVCAHMGFRSIGSAQDLIAALRQKGFLHEAKRQSARSLIPKASFIANEAREAAARLESILTVPCLGSVPAGHPLEAIEERIANLAIDISSIKKPYPKEQEVYAVRAQGESMMGAGILDRDWLVVQYQNDASANDIVIARFDHGGEVTCKRLGKEKGRGWFLQPENPKFNIVYAEEKPFTVVGKVIALHRVL